MALTSHPPPHSSGPIFFLSHHHFNMLPSYPAVFHSWTFCLVHFQTSWFCTFFCQEINSLSTYLLVLTEQDTWDQSRQDGAKTSKKPMGRYRYLCLKEKDWKARRSKSSSYSPKNWQVWERKFKVVRDVAACLEYRWQGQKLLGENCSRKKFTFSDSKLQGNYHKKQKCFRNTEMRFLFQLCSIGAVRLASVFTREWHFPHGHVLTRQIDEEFQAFPLITSFSFCNGIKT